MNILEPTRLSDAGLEELIALLRGELDEAHGDLVRQTAFAQEHLNACRERDRRAREMRPVSLEPDEDYNPPRVGDVVPVVLDTWARRLSSASRN